MATTQNILINCWIITTTIYNFCCKKNHYGFSILNDSIFSPFLFLSWCQNTFHVLYPPFNIKHLVLLPASCLPCDMDIQRALWWLLWLPLPSTYSFVFLVPVFLLTFDGTVRGVPTAVVHSLLLTIVTLQNQTKRHQFSQVRKIPNKYWNQATTLNVHSSIHSFLRGQIFQDYKQSEKYWNQVNLDVLVG